MKVKEAITEMVYDSAEDTLEFHSIEPWSYAIKDKYHKNQDNWTHRKLRNRLSIRDRIKDRMDNEISAMSELSLPEDITPGREVLRRTEALWINALEESGFEIGQNFTVSPADDNSIDIFWMNKDAQLLVNVPRDEKQSLFIQYIDRYGQSVVHFTDGHAFNINNFLRRLALGLD